MSNARNMPSATLPGFGLGSLVNVAEEAGFLCTSIQMSDPVPRPGDDAPAGTVGTGEDTCPRCSGTGKVDGNHACPDCNGTGIIIQGIGGG